MCKDPADPAEWAGLLDLTRLSTFLQSKPWVSAELFWLVWPFCWTPIPFLTAMQQCSPNSNPGMLSSQARLGVVGLCLRLCDSKVNPGGSLLIAQPSSSLMFSTLKTHRLYTRSFCLVWFPGQLLNSPSLVSTQPCLTSPSARPGTVPLHSLFWTPCRNHHRWVSGARPLLSVSCFLQLDQMVWFYTGLLHPQPPALCLELYMNTKQFESFRCFQSWLVGLICCLWSWTCTSWSCFTSPIIKLYSQKLSA